MLASLNNNSTGRRIIYHNINVSRQLLRTGNKKPEDAIPFKCIYICTYFNGKCGCFSTDFQDRNHENNIHRIFYPIINYRDRTVFYAFMGFHSLSTSLFENPSICTNKNTSS